MEGAESLVVTAAMAEAELDDFGDSSRRQLSDQVADLSIRVVAGRVEKGCGDFDFERFGGFNKVHERGW